jgi:hypothetical protein
MKRIRKLATGALFVVGATTGIAAMSVPAEARVSVGIGIGIPGPVYGPAYYPPGPCYNYDYYYPGYCGYPAYADPVFIGGVWYNGPHYYRTFHGQQQVWLGGSWHGDFRGGHGGRRG